MPRGWGVEEKRGVCYQVPPSLAPGCVFVSMVSSWRCGSFSVLRLGVTPARVALLLSYPAPYTLESSWHHLHLFTSNDVATLSR